MGLKVCDGCGYMQPEVFEHMELEFCEECLGEMGIHITSGPPGEDLEETSILDALDDSDFFDA